MENSQGIQEIAPTRELSAPYVVAIRKEAKDKIKGHDRSLDIVFDEINKQAINGFRVNESKIFPGVRFSSIHLCVTPELIRRINPEIKPWQESEAQKHYVYFLEPAAGKNPGGNAYSVLDLGIDRFIRGMSSIAEPLGRGGIPPAIDIYLVGAPNSFGGRVTQDWIDQIKKAGFDPHGKLYAEFMQEHLPKDPKELEKTVIIIQGVSKGAITGAETSKNLSEEIKTKAKIVQRLYDGPVGNHERNLPSQAIKGANMVIGMAGEALVRKIGEKMGTEVTGINLSQTEPQFYIDMAEKFNLPQDDAGQSKLKNNCLWHEVLALAKGNPLDKYDERTFVRKPEIDPANLDIGNLRRIFLNDLKLFWKKKFIASQNGKVFNVPTSRKAHFFAHKKSFRAWREVMQFVEGRSSTSDQ